MYTRPSSPAVRQRGHRARHSWRRYALWAAGIVAVLLLANFGMWAIYRGKVLPNVSLGPVQVGGIPYSELSDKVPQGQLLPDQIELATPDKQETIAPADLGIGVDWPATQENLKKQRSIFPLLNLLVHRTVPVTLAVNEQVFSAEEQRLASSLTKDAEDSRVRFDGSQFFIAPAHGGYSLDEQAFRPALLAALAQGHQTLEVPIHAGESPQSDNSRGLNVMLDMLKKRQGYIIKLSYGGQTVQPTPADIGSWYVESGVMMTDSESKVRDYLKRVAPNAANIGDATAAIQYMLLGRGNQHEWTFVLADNPHNRYTYCTASRGVDQAFMSDFRKKAALTLGDPRGWNVGGKVTFEQVDKGCDFTLWLSAPSQMTSFGGLCDNYYSCRSGRNVVINFDRWQGATDPWNAAGGNIEDYRVMVTNHEVGHWLGFAHRFCTSPGQPAPVMQQQSIDLQGCKFNPWPTEPELTTLKQARGIAMLPAREEFMVAAAPCACGQHAG